MTTQIEMTLPLDRMQGIPTALQIHPIPCKMEGLLRTPESDLHIQITQYHLWDATDS